MKHYPGGRIKAVGANSPATLRGRSFRVIIQDDLDGFKDNVEGDPSAQADRRAATQPRALRIKCSTPTLKGSSRIWKALEQSTFEQLLCPCPKCDHAQTLEWEQVIGDDAAPENTRYKCISCAALWTDRERGNAVREGARRNLWLVRNPKAKAKGLHMNGLYRLMGEKNSMSGILEEAWREYLAAKAAGEKSYQVWVNTFLALCYEPANSTIEPNPLWQRRENYNPQEQLPWQVLVLMAAVDVQSNRLLCEVRGFGLGQESWGVEYREFAGDPTERHVWDELDIFLSTGYFHPIRGKIRAAQCFIDAGGNKQNEAYIFTEGKNGRGIYACRGARDLNAPIVSPLRKAGYNQVPFYFVGTQGIKDTLHSRLLLKNPGPGFFHWPAIDCYDLEYFKQLTAEKKIVAAKGVNRGKLMWVAPEGARNEPWDCNVYMVAAMEAAGFNERRLRRIAENNEKLRLERNLPPPPPSQVTTLKELKVPPAMPDPITAADLKAMASPPSPISGGLPPVAAPDPTAAQNAPMSAPVQPKRRGLRVWGRGQAQMGRDFSPWGR